MARRTTTKKPAEPNRFLVIGGYYDPTTHTTYEEALQEATEQASYEDELYHVYELRAVVRPKREVEIEVVESKSYG